MYRKISNIRRAKSLNLNVYRLGLQLSLSNILKPSAKWRMNMQMEQRRQAMLQYIWVINNLIAYQSVSYIRKLTYVS